MPFEHAEDLWDDLERALQLEPHNAETLCYCGQALAATGQTELSLDFLRKAIDAEPDSFRHNLAAISVLEGIEFVAEHPWSERFLVECLDAPGTGSDCLCGAAYTARLLPSGE